ncbi:hypothetical protein CCL07_26945 [Pseudomonas congelans]|uniref:extracellular solute-binding protein n=1 Tax=Pseudomonas congelans TaxID=200452 RepID=UPI000BB61362|nr:hypothetical protein CCL07_26945 [Pseudomonas congelans]
MKNSAKLLLASSVLSTCFVFSGSATAGTVTIATVNNSDMIRMQRLSKTFEEKHPDIKLNWVVLEENVLRQRLTTDIATKGGQFDVLTIGMYEASLWGQKGWLQEMKDLPASYALDQNLWLEAQQAGQALLQTRFQHRQHCASLIERIETLRNGLAEHRLANFTGAMLRHHYHKSTKYMAQWIEAKNRNKDEKPA